jgi:hypothetical protein
MTATIIPLVSTTTWRLRPLIFLPLSWPPDKGKKTPGRKRGLAVDVMRLIIAVVVMAASAHDNHIGTSLLSRVAAENPGVSKAFVDAGFEDQVAIHVAVRDRLSE